MHCLKVKKACLQSLFTKLFTSRGSSDVLIPQSGLPHSPASGLSVPSPGSVCFEEKSEENRFINYVNILT